MPEKAGINQNLGTGKKDIFKSGFGMDENESQIIVLVIPEHDYTERLVKVVHDLVDLDLRICYVSLNRPHNTLMSSFKKEGISIDKMFVVDAITRTAMVPPECSSCDYVSSPGALTELSVAISKVMDRKEGFGYIIFDSLSTLLVYESDTTIAKFVHFLMAKVRVAGCNAIFTVLKQDADSILVKDINMFADKVIDMERWTFKS